MDTVCAAGSAVGGAVDGVVACEAGCAGVKAAKEKGVEEKGVAPAAVVKLVDRPDPVVTSALGGDFVLSVAKIEEENASVVGFAKPKNPSPVPLLLQLLLLLLLAVVAGATGELDATGVIAAAAIGVVGVAVASCS